MHATASSRTQPQRNGNSRRTPFGAPILLRRRYLGTLGALLSIALIVGCARQYHWYECGCSCVNYNYCPPGPLPYSSYHSCPTPVAKSYRFEAGQQVAGEATSEDPSDDPSVPKSSRRGADTAWTLLPY